MNLLFLDQQYIDRLDDDLHLVSFLEPHPVKGIQGHDRAHVGPGRYADVHLTHDRAALDGGDLPANWFLAPYFMLSPPGHDFGNTSVCP